MDGAVLYRERLPRYVFKGSTLERGSLKVYQLLHRMFALYCFCAGFYFIEHPEFDGPMHVMEILVAACMFLLGITLLYRSETQAQQALDGSVPTVIIGDWISLPPRLGRRLLGKHDFIARDDIASVSVIRGRGTQSIGRRDGVRWKGAPIGIRVEMKSGNIHLLGYKPPGTVMDIVDILRTDWLLVVDDPGTGMGIGMRFNEKGVLWERSYEEIMSMGLFEWQDRAEDLNTIMDRDNMVSFENPPDPAARRNCAMASIGILAVCSALYMAAMDVSYLIIGVVGAALVLTSYWYLCDRTRPRHMAVDDQGVLLYLPTGRIKYHPLRDVKATYVNEKRMHEAGQAIVVLSGHHGRWLRTSVPVCREIESRYSQMFGKPPIDARYMKR